MKGSDIFNSILNETGEAREKSLIGHIFSGNVPSWMNPEKWPAVEIPISGDRKLVVKVSPDYISVGNDSDFARSPLWPKSAQLIADYYNAILPTAKLSDIIYERADTKLAPKPIPPSSKMETSGEMLRHNGMIEEALRGVSPSESNLIAGHKKDIVIAPGLDGSRVAIYGWHTAPKKVIQPFSTIHAAEYSDYSHGARLISKHATVDGKQFDLLDAFVSPEISPLIASAPFYPAFPAKKKGFTTVDYRADEEGPLPIPESIGPRQIVSSAMPAIVAIGIFLATLSIKKSRPA